jgi:hypothetical protein
VSSALPARGGQTRYAWGKTADVVARGYRARELAAEACPYANICETCPNFITTTDFNPAIADQLADLRKLRDDADRRGWTAEARRHERVIESLESPLRRLGARWARNP